jgi:phage terminase large subunit GpA-like protein
MRSGVDSGFRSHVVYEWCRTRHSAYALKGVDGWNRPALGTPSFVDIDLGGRKVAAGTRVWPVGTWSLKGHWYEDLRREGAAAGREVDPPGYCHFGKFLDDVYFKQVTAEYLAEATMRGRRIKSWQLRGKEDNHFLDCRVYNMALADHLGLSRMTEDDWKLLARERAAPLIEQSDLFAPRPLAVQAQSLASAAIPAAPMTGPEINPESEPARAAPAPESNPVPASHPASPAPLPASSPASSGSGWIGRDTGGWFR